MNSLAKLGGKSNRRVGEELERRELGGCLIKIICVFEIPKQEK